MDLNVRLVDSSRGLLSSPAELNACLNARGLYNSFQFVLRLCPAVHRQLESLPTGIHASADSERVQAFSTYLHETIHWWQHVGSTGGLLRSLSYPAQAHANYTHLKRFLSAFGLKKSIQTVVERSTERGGFGTPLGIANTIVNNHYDIEFFRILTSKPELVTSAVKNHFFESVGHSYMIAYSNMLALLSRSFDREWKLLPDARRWEDAFRARRDHKLKGYYRGSPVMVYPVGLYQIFEGQARFGQLQYLYFASGGKLTWADIRTRGMLSETYAKAFETFLRLAELGWPSSVDSPTVALLLLICDMAINPSAGFPLPLKTFDTFIEDIDPAVRFTFFCRAAARAPNVASAIVEYSRDEYFAVSESLSHLLQLDSTELILKTTADWMKQEQFQPLMEQYNSWDFSPENLPVSVLFSHFLAFMKDKLEKPEFFCWPGACMTGARLVRESVTLFERHSALFVDQADDDGVFPQKHPGIDPSLLQRTFQSFYQFNIIYDMTRQWVASKGPFEYDYRWLSSSASKAEMKKFADSGFERTYGIHPDRCEAL